MDATTSLAEDLQDLQLDRPTKGLKSTEELEKLTVDEHLSDIERAVYLLSTLEEGYAKKGFAIDGLVQKLVVDV
ncbi:hypothetical protein FSP39_002640 [Pinctada imbricata]|uniref:Uncharacterized protein n=1 Tax=Pinctada imbricata TaxID=66713 RepID=A0AA88XXZ9_PINIB|nr:hypothetical protein FSP39_002640 [Pinctada imbricata]